MTLFQIHCTWNENSTTYDVSIPWLDRLFKKGNKIPSKKLVLVGVNDYINSIKELRFLTGYDVEKVRDIVERIQAGGAWAYPGKDIPDVSKCPHLRFERR